VPTIAASDEMVAKILGLKSKTDGVSVKVVGELNRPPYEKGNAGAALYEHAKTLAAEIGFDLVDTATGGGSDGNFTAPHTATLDGLGVDGKGGSTTFPIKSEDPRCDPTAAVTAETPSYCLPVQVTWTAPPLDVALLRYSRDQVKQIITYGRPGTPMPPWGIKSGKGVLNAQGIDDLANYLESITVTPEEAKKRFTQELVDARAQNPGKSDGLLLFELQCARCHTKNWSFFDPAKPVGQPPGPMGGGAYGPNLTDGDTVRQFAGPTGLKDHFDWVAAGKLPQEQYGTRGISTGRMPHFADILTKEQIQAIVDYERGL